MFAVVFEVHPGAGKKDEYLQHARHLKPLLEKTDGFLDNERFESKRRNGWVLSLSTWRDEKSVVRWRSTGEHHRIQRQGREHVFSDYRLRVCEITADNMPPAGLDIVQHRLDESEKGTAKALSITELVPGDGVDISADPQRIPAQLGLDPGRSGLVEYEVYESIYNPGKMLLLAGWRTARDAAGWQPALLPGAKQQRHRCMRSIREYGMFDRAEAPQYYPDVPRR
ncbi:antibiotic biosynthesis monooxygenase family protein [Bordetella flabilis]|uniref:Antibiotic biosynthesis monooxygenase n=1 Tax=Bordetella flabilis TaxID=463014 RepID=A0A193GKQ6_9BORD|nr:antibiotic biosynthesis monooxygenase [Bordetella flabilis]ANN79996.1 antibiotic biosynthesis monooxygenase [Bordetella flabilis]